MNALKLKQHLEKADGWVIRNLRREGNSVFPSTLIEIEADKRVGEKMLTCIIGRPVKIRQTEWGYICEM